MVRAGPRSRGTARRRTDWSSLERRRDQGGNQENAHQGRSTTSGAGKIARRSRDRTKGKGARKRSPEGIRFQAGESTKRNREIQEIRGTGSRSARAGSGVVKSAPIVAGQ